MKKKIWKIIGALFLFFLVVGIFSEGADSPSEGNPEKGQEASAEASLESGPMERPEKESEGQNNKTAETEKKAESQENKAEEAGNSGEEPTNAAEDKKQEKTVGEYIFPDSDSRYLTEEEVRKIDPGELRLARNELFARHGYIFQDEDNEYEKKNAELINLVEAEGGKTETASGETEAAAEENGGQAAGGADAPYFSREYLECYLAEHHIEVNDFREAEKIAGLIQGNLGEAVPIKEDGGFLKKPYYAMTKNFTGIFYQGQMKENKPDGMGAIYKAVCFFTDAGSIGESDTAQIYESPYGAEQQGFACMYAGHFKEGRAEGYGMEFSVPGDEDYFVKEFPISGCQSEADIQGAFLRRQIQLGMRGNSKKGNIQGKGMSMLIWKLMHIMA